MMLFDDQLPAKLIRKEISKRVSFVSASFFHLFQYSNFDLVEDGPAHGRGVGNEMVLKVPSNPTQPILSFTDSVIQGRKYR